MADKPTKKTDQVKRWDRKNKPKKSAYQIATRKIRKSFLILCEGVVTEPLYFKSIAASNIEAEALGFGASKCALVQMAEQYCQRNQVDKSRTEVWVVFDFDVKYDQIENQKEDFNQAIQQARLLSFKVAYSNDCFELWLVLHTKLLEAQQTRFQYYDYLSKHLEVDYEETGKKRETWLKYLPTINSHPEMDKALAMQNAIRLFETQSHLAYCDQNPVTTIFQLAHELDPESFPMPE